MLPVILGVLYRIPGVAPVIIVIVALPETNFVLAFYFFGILYLNVRVVVETIRCWCPDMGLVPAKHAGKWSEFRGGYRIDVWQTQEVRLAGVF